MPLSGTPEDAENKWHPLEDDDELGIRNDESSWAESIR